MTLSPRLAARCLVALVLAALLSGCAGEALLYEADADLHAEAYDLRLIRISEEGVTPSEVDLLDAPGGVVFLNDTQGQVVRVVFRGQNLDGLFSSYTKGFELSEDEQSTVTEPIVPGAAVSKCLRCAGDDLNLHYDVIGLDTPVSGKIRVRPLPKGGDQ